jgi:hypothetical protein
MATFNKTYAASEYIAESTLDLDLDDKYICLTNTAPTTATTTYSSLTEIASGNGYTTGGNAAALVTSAQSSGTYKLVLTSPATWTGSGAGMATFRYAVLYQNSGTKPVVGWWDYGSGVTLAAGETFTVTLDGTNGVIQLA